jgi:hypothetical protein
MPDCGDEAVAARSTMLTPPTNSPPSTDTNSAAQAPAVRATGGGHVVTVRRVKWTGGRRKTNISGRQLSARGAWEDVQQALTRVVGGFRQTATFGLTF